MDETLNFVLLLVCIICVAIRGEIINGRISELKGKTDSLSIYMKELKKESGGEDG